MSLWTALMMMMIIVSMWRDYVSELRPPRGLLFVPQVAHEYGEPRWNDTDRGKLIHPPQFSCNPTSSHLVENQEELAKGIINYHDRGPTALLPLPKKGVLRILSPLKIHRPRPGLNPRTLGQMTSVLTTRPQGKTMDCLHLVQDALMATSCEHKNKISGEI
jgi:hypothetical protein